MEQTLEPPVGQRTVDRYRLEGLLGRGGMADVYRATDTRLGRTVAVKRFLPYCATDATFVHRFLRELRLVARLEHPSILPVHDFGEHEGVPFLVMPCVEGCTLAERIGLAGFPPGLAAGWLHTLADALDTAHAAGVLHRDVKSTNVLIDGNDRPMLSDFGIPRVRSETSNLAAIGVVRGTALHTAPELARGGPATPETDRYALAVLGYLMLCGKPPFEGESPLAVLHRHVTRPVPRISLRAPALSTAANAVFQRALAKNPRHRPTSCVMLAEELASCLPGAGPTRSLRRASGEPSSST